MTSSGQAAAGLLRFKGNNDLPQRRKSTQLQNLSPCRGWGGVGGVRKKSHSDKHVISPAQL